MSKPILELKNVQTLVNKGTSNEAMILKGINLTVNRGDFITIVGTNGAGKSTLFNVIGVTCMPMLGKFFITVTILPKAPKKNGRLSSHESFRTLNWARLRE